MHAENERTVTIMIVDDEFVSVTMLANLLEREGFATFASSTGIDAVTLASQRQPDLILLDVNLPGVRGSTICARLKENEATADIPVLFVSGNADTATKIECFESGGLDYITKPYESREVLARIRTHLRLSRAQRALGQLLLETIHSMAQAQQALLPPRPEEMPEAKFAVYCHQLSEAGGDFYNVVKVSDQIFDYITADVCGHDISVALVTSALKALFTQNCTPYYSPVEILGIVNRVMPAILQVGQYVAISWIRVNRSTNKALVINAGQPPIIILPANGIPVKLELHGDIVGVFEHVAFDQKEITLAPGDRVLLYSDGLVEADGKSAGSRGAGITRLMELCADSSRLTLSHLIETLSERIFSNRIPEDDIVIMGVDI
jgi:sigma-B regulation protein RsbU (phosphoserine phosphatase)